MVKGQPTVSLPLTRTWSLCSPRVSAVNNILKWEGGRVSTTNPILRDISDVVVLEASEMISSSAVILSWSEHGLPLESVSSTST